MDLGHGYVSIYIVKNSSSCLLMDYHVDGGGQLFCDVAALCLSNSVWQNSEYHNYLGSPVLGTILRKRNTELCVF